MLNIQFPVPTEHALIRSVALCAFFVIAVFKIHHLKL